MSFELTAVIHKIFPTESKTDTFQAREFVLKSDGQYPQFIKFQLTQDKCDLIENYQEGQQIKVYFDLRGREWQEKYFTNLQAWKIEPAQAAAPPPPAAGAPSFSEPKMPDTPMKSYEGQAPKQDDLDDLPF